MDLLGPCTNVFLTAYAHVRTEPQCDIGQTRGKKSNDGAMRDVFVGYLSPLPHSGSNKSDVFGTVPIQQAPQELSTRNCPRV